MGSAPKHYLGREQAYVKHFLLKNYFSDLITAAPPAVSFWQPCR
jgi:hypothetical protein